MIELHPDEKIIMYIRRHWFWIVLETLGVFLTFALPIILVLVLEYFVGFPSLSFFGVSLSSISTIIILVWAIFCWVYMAERFTKYSLNFWILTNKRLIESELEKLFDRKISTLELPDIEDITIRENGFLANVIGWGSLQVETAGAVREFTSEDILDPVGVQRAIFDAKLALRQDEKDIERGEVEQITHRVMRENNIFPQEQNYENPKKEIENNGGEEVKHDFDWAKVEESQMGDKRNLDDEMGEIDETFKNNVDNALRTE